VSRAIALSHPVSDRLPVRPQVDGHLGPVNLQRSLPEAVVSRAPGLVKRGRTSDAVYDTEPSTVEKKYRRGPGDSAPNKTSNVGGS